MKSYSDSNASSDERMKIDIQRITNAGSRVSMLNGVNFTDISTYKRSTGVIAQEVVKVLPEAVVENEDGLLSVKYGNMIGLLIEAIKELQTEVAELKVARSNVVPLRERAKLVVTNNHDPLIKQAAEPIFEPSSKRSLWVEGLGVGIATGSLLSLVGVLGAYFGYDMMTPAEVSVLLTAAGITTVLGGVIGWVVGLGLPKRKPKRYTPFP